MMSILRTLLDILVFLAGLALVGVTLLSAVRTFVLPRQVQDAISGAVYRTVRSAFMLRVGKTDSYARTDRILALYAPVAVLCLLPTWLFLVLTGYMAMFWATGIRVVKDAFVLSGSSLLTLGFASDGSWLHMTMTFTEATIGLLLVALLIAYLPAMYGAFARREAAVNQLDVRAGTPPSVGDMVLRAHRIGKLADGGLTPIWRDWEMLFTEIEESHTTYPPLVFFRSPKPLNSWVTASACILDSAAFVRSTVDIARDPQADLCIRAGYLTFRSIADMFGVVYRSQPEFPRDSISVTRQEYDAVYDRLRDEGVPLILDRERAWLDFAGWRVNYDQVLIAVAAITVAPPAPWSSDRANRDIAKGTAPFRLRY